MAFQFSLAPLLRLRQSVERQRALRLREASLKVAHAAGELAALDRYLIASLEEDADALRDGRYGVELEFASLSAEEMQELRARLHSTLRQLELERQAAATEYHNAYRQREALDNLRRRQQRIFQQEQLRRQQRERDEAHLLQLGKSS